MTLAQSLLPEFDQEMAGTRQVLGRIPPDKLDWKAHPKSNTLRWVGSHLANLPSWVTITLTSDSLDIDPPGGEPYRTQPADSVPALLAAFDQNVASARAALQTVSDADFLQPWSLLKTGAVIFTIPRQAVVRTFVLNHIIHHRAALCVYLRLNNVPVPGLYGPSGDET